MVRSDDTDVLSPVGEFRYLGGHEALDLVNALDGRPTSHPVERLRSYEDLVWWAYGAGMLSGRTARRLLRLARERPRAAAQVLSRARRLREALHRVADAAIASQPPDADALEVLNEELGRALAATRLEPAGACCGWGYATDDEALDQMLFVVVRAAADLLTSDRVRFLKRCAGDSCGWVFLDESRNRRRRWCDMRECGNRAKARRHYAKVRRRRPPDGD